MFDTSCKLSLSFFEFSQKLYVASQAINNICKIFLRLVDVMMDL